VTSRHLSFLASHIPYQRARVAILGVPLERTVSFRGGTSQGPSAIRYASSSIESFSAIFRCDLSDIGVCDLGDLDSEAHLGDILEELSRETERILRDGKGLVVLGGEHTVTLGAIRGATAALGRVQVLVFDAHSDLNGLIRVFDRVFEKISEHQPELSSVATNPQRPSIVDPNRLVGKIVTFSELFDVVGQQGL